MDAVIGGARIHQYNDVSVMRALLISTYEMGRQPFGLASPAAWLRDAGWVVDCVDVAKEPLREAIVEDADLVGFYLPMHTATRLAAPIIERVRHLNRTARICAYGLYAPLNADWLRTLGVDDVLGAEFEEDLTEFAREIAGARAEPFDDARGRQARPRHESALHGSAPAQPAQNRPVDQRRGRALPRIQFLVPDRAGLPTLDRYATLQRGDGSRALVGYTEASRGCRHLCRHCPIVPIYEGQFRVVQPEVVLADITAQVAAGARHITFGDPDFFNGPTHARRIVAGLHAAHPTVTYDVTIKIEHLLAHDELLPELRDTGCLFVTSAVESIDDRVLTLLEKGHTRRDFVGAVVRCREVGLTLVPTFVAFHPWLTLDDYCDLLDTIEVLGLIDEVASIQLAIRLLIPQGSRLLELDEIRRLVGPFDPTTLTYRWLHPDPRVDELQQDVSTMVGVKMARDRRTMFDAVSTLAHERVGRTRPSVKPARDRATVPYLNEPWYC
jgi:radical SAM superfamily enzyme YgiQ (UPF0313 family)